MSNKKCFELFTPMGKLPITFATSASWPIVDYLREVGIYRQGLCMRHISGYIVTNGYGWRDVEKLDISAGNSVLLLTADDFCVAIKALREMQTAPSPASDIPSPAPPVQGEGEGVSPIQQHARDLARGIKHTANAIETWLDELQKELNK